MMGPDETPYGVLAVATDPNGAICGPGRRHT